MTSQTQINFLIGLALIFLIFALVAIWDSITTRKKLNKVVKRALDEYSYRVRDYNSPGHNNNLDSKRRRNNLAHHEAVAYADVFSNAGLPYPDITNDFPSDKRADNWELLCNVLEYLLVHYKHLSSIYNSSSSASMSQADLKTLYQEAKAYAGAIQSLGYEGLNFERDFNLARITRPGERFLSGESVQLSRSARSPRRGAIEYGIENGEDYIKVYEETPTGNIRWRKSFYKSDRKSQEFETSGHRFEDFKLESDPNIAYFDVPEQVEHHER